MSSPFYEWVRGERADVRLPNEIGGFRCLFTRMEVDRDSRKGSDLLDFLLSSLFVVFFFLSFYYLLGPSRPVEASFSPFSIAGSPIGARVVVMKLA